MGTEFSYLILLLIGVVILLENRLKRLVLLLAFQSVFLLVPLFEDSGYGTHSLFLAGMIVLFKVVLTPWILFWTARRTNSVESTFPRVGYIPTFALLMIGAIVGFIILGFTKFRFGEVNQMSFLYTFLLLYVGMVGFVVRRHWVGVISSFAVFENGTFLLTQILRTELPLGIEFGSFLDAVFIIGAAATLRISMEGPSENEKEEVSA
ncbi:formate hydrogenase [Leptospira ellisii]|uniref:Formate hydrogenase n=1 Tax=Leptospira ellisii TaxID=2023197 RepID=A0A2N0BQ23_9LEPT|nr:formate hydrogenase [Leptospira ellisii]MDV6237849.1 formate hydrogenase [Leptospira ellisii]PJZ93458.1 formate hydrogenase [Leptospira ellisii]PKA06100.1 formate hydrogenase [Leptospira ellisii]